MALKRGKLSNEEMEFIRANIERLSIHDIAIQINRSDATVQKFANAENLTYTGMSEEIYDDTLLRAKLEEKPYWEEVSRQFSESELEYFAITWIRMMKQFREDILYSEELQVKQWITLEIMGNKVMRDRKDAQQQIERLTRLLDQEYSLPEDVRDATTIAHLETELSMVRNAQGSYTTEHSKILDRIEKIQKDLKAARADRVKKIEDSKSSWAGFLRSLEDEDTRQKVGEDIEILKMAKEGAIKRLSEYHTYEDGQVDQPFLTPDTVKDDD